jgi:hypothetical protein
MLEKPMYPVVPKGDNPSGGVNQQGRKNGNEVFRLSADERGKSLRQ